MSSSRFLCGKWFSSDIPGNAAPSLHLSKVDFCTFEESVSPGGRGMFGSRYSSFLWFFSREVAPKIEPQSPISITCPITQLRLFYSMKTPPELVTGFQPSHLQLSSLLWRLALGDREKELFWMETGRKIIPGAAHPLPWKPKYGDVHRNPFSSWKSGWVYSKQEVGRVCSCSLSFPSI